MDPISSQRGYDRTKKERKIVEGQLAEVRAINLAKMKAIEDELSVARFGAEKTESYFINKLAEIDAAVSTWDARDADVQVTLPAPQQKGSE